MKRTTFDESRDQRLPAETETIKALRCAAYGCPLRACTREEGGQWLCTCHSKTDSAQWQNITHRIHNHSWLVQFVDELQRLLRAHQPWRPYAVNFWAASEPRCRPHPLEDGDVYFIRMRQELWYRAETVAQAPSIKVAGKFLEPA